MHDPSVDVETLLAHRGWVRALAWSLLRDAHAVDEVEQETWLRALRSPPSDDTAARGWLATVVRNVVKNRFRSSSRRRTHETAAARPATSPSTVDVVARADAQQGVVQAVMRLREPYRTTLLLRHYDGLPPREIAARLGVSVETVRSRVRRALIELRADLEQERSERGGLLALLTPLLGDGPPPGAGIAAATSAGVPTVTTPLLGGLAMAVTTKKLIAAAAVVLVALTTWVALDPPATESEPVAVTAGAGEGEDTSTAGADSTSPARTRRNPAGGAGDTTEGDSTSEPESAVTTDVRVSLSDGTPVPDARALAWREFADPTEWSADGNGVVRVGGDGLDRLAVFAPGRPVVVAEIVPGASDQVVVLPEGRSVRGIVRVNHATPEEPVLLRIQPGGDDPTEGLPKRVRNELSGLGWGYGHASVRTGEGGAFAFHGLPASADAAITVPGRRHEWAESGSLAHTIAIPSQGLVLDLLSRPHYRGRVLFGDGGVVPRPKVRFDWTVEGDPEHSGHGVVTGDDDGTFEVFLPSARATSAELRVSDEGSISWRTLELPLHGSATHDLGDLALDAIRQVQVRVVGGGDTAVEGARLLSGQSVTRTDADGLVTVRVAGERALVRAAALGYESTEFHVAQGAAQPVTLRLVPTTQLSVRVEAKDGRVPGVRVRLTTTGERPFTTSDSASPSTMDVLGGATRSSESSDWAEPDGTLRTSTWFEPDAGGRVVLNGLRADQRMRLEVFDSFGTRHDDKSVRLGDAETREVVLRIQGETHDLTGVVHGFDGEPLEDALVFATDAAGTPADGFPERMVGRATRTDDQGRFEFTNVRTRALHVAVTSEAVFDGRSHAPWIRENVDTTSEGELAVHMELGRTLTLRLRLPDETWLTDAWLDPQIDVPVREPDWFWPTDELEGGPPGTYVLRGLPNELTRLALHARVWNELGGDNYELEVDPAVPQHTIELGNPTSSDRAESE